MASSKNKSDTSSLTSSILRAGLSILFITTIGLSPSSKALDNTNLVCGIGPSCASTTRITPSAIFKVRSTSPEKSACPGVSIILIL